MRLAVEPVEGLVSGIFCVVNPFLPLQMRTNGWCVELTLTMCLLFLTDLRGEIFDRAIPLHVNFPCKTTPVRAVEARIKDLEVAERV